MLNNKKFSELLNEESNSSNAVTRANINGSIFEVKDNKLFVNSYELMEEDLTELARVLSKVVVYEGIDEIISTLQDRIDQLMKSNIDEKDRVIPIYDFRIMLDYATYSQTHGMYPPLYNEDDIDMIKDMVISRLEFYDIEVIKDSYTHHGDPSSNIYNYLACAENFWYISWCMDGSLESANHRLNSIKSLILKHYDADATIKMCTPIKLTSDGFEVIGDPVEFQNIPENELTLNSEFEAENMVKNIMNTYPKVQEIMSTWDITDPADVIAQLKVLSEAINNDSTNLTFNGKSIGIKSAFELVNLKDKISSMIPDLLEGKLMGYIISDKCTPIHPIIYKYYNERNWGSTIASRLFNSLSKICYRWWNDGDDPIDFTSYPSFQFMIGVNQFLKRTSYKNSIMFNWGLSKVYSKLKADSSKSIHPFGLYAFEPLYEDIQLDFIEQLMIRESNGDHFEWETEIKKFNTDHSISFHERYSPLLEEDVIGTAYALIGAIWEITKVYPNFLNDGSEDYNYIDPGKF